MLDNLTQLNQEEKDLLIAAPTFVAALIGGADGNFTDDEIERAAEVIHIKTFSEKHEHVREIYELLDHSQTEQDLVSLMVSLPKTAKERNLYLSTELEQLNGILPKLNYSFSIRYYKSLRQIAHLVANADGGFWGMGAMHEAERVFVKLPMLIEPKKD
ncbi:hypothetical protein OAB01_03635 [Bacteroidia bacterium]|jgi:hypothetical protein|nr:hypothetical protein [Bacteroidia bacterium]